MYLVIDIGNTRVKIAVFKNDEIFYHHVFKTSRIISEVKKIATSYPIKRAILSSTATISEKQLKRINDFVDLTIVTYQTSVPFINAYQTPKTLGIDRIGLTCAAFRLFPNQNVLIIDAGTCITYDLLTKEGVYKGGAIAPGIRMRYISLQKQTAKLPLLETKLPEFYIGNNTANSIHSGVVNGTIQEIDGIIEQYKNDFKDLTVVLTGGDMNFLAKQLKSIIFANQNFLLEGLYTILTQHAGND